MQPLPEPLYATRFGKAYLGDSRHLVQGLADESVDLLITSPPFALQRQKEYGNLEQEEYVEWLLGFSGDIRRVLRDTGSFVLDLGGAYQKARPVRSLYNYRVLVRMCDELGWNLAEEFFWFNPSRLPSPIEWVNKRKIRAKDAVDTVWWFSKSDFPKADVRSVLAPYSDRMKLLLKDSVKYYSPKKRPSGHDISDRFSEDKGGAIPPNLLEIPNTESNSKYLRWCKLLGVNGHPARFPERLPEFFIRFLTSPGDMVLDIFTGSNTTGAVAERLRRKWIAFEIKQEYLALSAFRFIRNVDAAFAHSLFSKLRERDAANITIPQQDFDQPELTEF